jgi:threonine dehydratase
MGSTIYIKREDQQPVFSFKCRGAFNRMFNLSADQKKRGVCCVSAGNHAQGVALAAQNLGIKATIIMPTFAPEIKVENVRRLGADVVLFGNNFDEAKRECARICEERALTFIPPYDDPLVIAGQGTVGMEILSQMKQTRLDAIFVCCGGGGLLAGIAAFVKRVRPEVRIIGVNTFDSDSMRQSLINGTPTDIKTAGLFSDGTSIRIVGTECVKVCKHYVDDMVLVSNDEICAAIKDCFEETRSILEPAGALGIAGMKRYLSNNPGLKGGVFVCVASGANMNFDRLHFVTERASVGEGKETLLSVKLPEKPGSLKSLLVFLGPRNITELAYRYCDDKDAHVFCGFDVATPGEVTRIHIATIGSGKTQPNRWFPCIGYHRE